MGFFKRWETLVKEFTESAIAAYLECGGEVNPDVTLHLFQFIESDKELLREYIKNQSWQVR